MTTIRTYIDTNLIGANAERHNPQEHAALKELRELTNLDGSKVVSDTISNRNLNEIDRTMDETLKRRLHQEAAILPREKLDHKVLGFNFYSDQYTTISSPQVIDVPDEEIFAELREILKDEMDARLLTVAIHNKYDVFLTCDKKTILKHSDKIHALFPTIEVMKPSDLLVRLQSRRREKV